MKQRKTEHLTYIEKLCHIHTKTTTATNKAVNKVKQRENPISEP